MNTDYKMDANLDDEEERDDTIVGVALHWTLTIFAGIGLIGGGAAYFLTRPKPVAVLQPQKVVPPTVRERPNVEVPQLPFTDVTDSAGITFRHENGAAGEKLLPETMGGGCAFLDFDGDGHQDILFIN